MKPKLFPELEEIINHLVYINNDNWQWLAEAEIQWQTSAYGRIVGSKKLSYYLKNLKIEIEFWETVL